MMESLFVSDNFQGNELVSLVIVALQGLAEATLAKEV